MYGGHRIDFVVVRRRRKTLEIAVEPDASVVVAAPPDAPIEAIAEKVRKRAEWIRRQPALLLAVHAADAGSDGIWRGRLIYISVDSTG